MAYDKNPSAGAKVTMGENAPIRHEGAGQVDSESLAAESYSQGGEFASNRGADPESNESSDAATLNRHTTSTFEPTNKSTRSHNERPSASHQPEITGNGGTAPTYVQSQYIRDPNPPHGRNLREVETFEGEGKLKDGMQAAFRAEVGSEDDPSRVAEWNKEHQGNRTAGKGKNSGLEGDETGYDALDAERNI
jgi:hypothetical protein